MTATKRTSFASVCRRGAAVVALGAAVLGWSLPAAAQDDEDDDLPSARPVVQTIAGTARLNAALGRLANNPRDLTALIDAGQAALDMNDLDAALGFFRRADALSPGSAAVKVGLAGAYVRKLDPFSAIPLFEQAARTGTLGATALADRGLAYDLVGDAIGAQRYYRQSLTTGRNDDTLRRLALSQAIDGDRAGMEATLSPLLQRQDRAAWRTRAFALAVLGRAEEAESIARATMPADLAVAMSAYLRYMPRLTRAQQAAAGDLGYFPRAADIGRDDPRVAQFVNQRPELAAANQALTPAGKPMGRETKAKDKRDGKDKPPVVVASVTRAAPPEVRPTREEIKPSAPPVVAAPTATIALAAPTPTSAGKPGPGPVFVVPPPPVVTPPATPRTAAPGFDLGRLGQPAQPRTPAPAAATSASAAKPRSLSEVFADLAAPSSESGPKAGAVDVTQRIKADAPPKPAAARAASPKPSAAETAKLKAEAEKKAKAEADKKAKAEADKRVKASPARIWVQVATGRDKKALGFDWRRMVKTDPATFKGKSPAVAAWGQTNRLLTGPFDSDQAATAYLARLKKAGVGGAFVFHSDAGEEVAALAAK